MSIIPIIASVAGGLLGMRGASRSANTQSRAARDAAQAQLTGVRETNQMMRDFRREDVQRFEPWMVAGRNALADYQQGIDQGFNFDFQADPGYQFRRDQGRDAVMSSAASRHGMNSGAAMKGLEQFGQDFASNEYGNVFARQYGMWNDRLNRLGQLAAGGQAAAGMQASTSQNYAGNIGQNTMQGSQAAAQGIANAGSARAAGQVGAANAFTGAIDNGIGAWQFNRIANAFLPQTQGGGAPMTSPRPMANPFLPRA